MCQLDNLCPSDIYSSLISQQLTEPWFHEIAINTTFDSDYPSFSTSSRNAAYHNISKSLSEVGNIGIITTDIRSIYGTLDTSQLNTMYTKITDLLRNPGQYKPSNCNNLCWNTTVDTITEEILLLLALSDFRDNIHTFLDESQEDFNMELNGIVNLLSFQADQDLCLAVGDSKLSSSWSIGSGIINAFAGLVPIVMTEVPLSIQLFSWVLTATGSIGGAIINGHNSGGIYAKVINLNNALFTTYGEYEMEMRTFFNNQVETLENDTTRIANNYGKLQAFSTCNNRLKAEMTNNHVSFGSVIEIGREKAKPAMDLQIYIALLPSKYDIKQEIKCKIPDNVKECCDNERTPKCYWDYVAPSAKSDIHDGLGSGGSTIIWMGAHGSNDPNNAIQNVTITSFNSALKSALNSNYSLKYLLDELQRSESINGGITTANVTINISDTLSLGLNVAKLSTQCYNKCGVATDHCFPWVTTCNCQRQEVERTCTGPSDEELGGCSIEYGESCGDSGLLSSTNVLMSNNEWKAIKDIKIGEIVINPLTGTGQKVLKVVTSIRNRKKLYSVNNLPFKFTSTISFLLYNDDRNNNDTIHGAVDIDKVLFYNPTMDKNNLKQIDLNRKLSIYSSNDISIQSLSINNININQFNEIKDKDGEILYDLILNDFGTSSIYVINNGIIVNNGWYDFNTLTRSTQIILGILDKLVKSNNDILHKLSITKIENRDLINDIASTISDHTISFFNVINDHVENVMVMDNLSLCNNYTIEISNIADIIKQIYDDELWIKNKVIQEFIARISPSLSYTFDSKQYKYYNQICFDEIGSSQLINKLYDAIFEATLSMVIYI